MRNRQGDSWAGEAVDAMEEGLAQKLLKRGGQKLELKSDEPLKKLDAYLLSRWIRGQTKVGVKWLAKELNMNAGTLSHGIWKIGDGIEKDSKLRKRWNTLKY